MKAAVAGREHGKSERCVRLDRATGDLLIAAVEGKVSEPFGDKTIDEWFATPSRGKRKRFKFYAACWGWSFRHRGIFVTSCLIKPRLPLLQTLSRVVVDDDRSLVFSGE